MEAAQRVNARSQQEYFLSFHCTVGGFQLLLVPRIVALYNPVQETIRNCAYQAHMKGVWMSCRPCPGFARSANIERRDAL